MNKRCFLVLGPEGSGTYMMAEALTEAGCEYVNSEYNLGNFLAACQHDTIVIRRSLPHAGEWIDLQGLVEEIWFANYEIVPVVLVREPNATIESVLRRMPQKRHVVRYNIAVTWRKLGELANTLYFLPIPYEAIVGSEGFRKWLFKEWKLPYPENYKFYDGNRKYYE